jgi:hypothetical protein
MTASARCSNETLCPGITLEKVGAGVKSQTFSQERPGLILPT